MLILLTAQLPKWKAEFVLNCITAKLGCYIHRLRISKEQHSSLSPALHSAIWTCLCPGHWLFPVTPYPCRTEVRLAPGYLLQPILWPLLSFVKTWASGHSSETLSADGEPGLSEGTPTYLSPLIQCIFRGKSDIVPLPPCAPFSLSGSPEHTGYMKPVRHVYLLTCLFIHSIDIPGLPRYSSSYSDSCLRVFLSDCGNSSAFLNPRLLH